MTPNHKSTIIDIFQKIAIKDIENNIIDDVIFEKICTEFYMDFIDFYEHVILTTDNIKSIHCDMAEDALIFSVNTEI